MRSLYPEIVPFQTHSFKVDEHLIYFEQSGNQNGIPVVFIHGGPGSGSNANHRRYFDPERFHIVNYDQRGCHRSKPTGCVDNNTTQHLIEDLEGIRNFLKIDKWLLFGGSWGSTLALLYAETYPDAVTGMILRGSFLAREADLDWFIKSGVNKIFPDYWQDFVSVIPEAEREDMALAYYKRLHGNNKQEQKQAAKAWSVWAGRIVTYLLDSVNGDSYDPGDLERAVNEVKIETHYARFAYFIEENQILKNIDLIPDVPVRIIHGRKDLTCLAEASWLLNCSLPTSKLMIVKDGGHLAGEAPMVEALIKTTDEMASLLK